MNVIQLIALIEDDLNSSTFECITSSGLLKTNSLKHKLRYGNEPIFYYLKELSNISSTEMLFSFGLKNTIDGVLEHIHVSFRVHYTVKNKKFYTFTKPVLHTVTVLPTFVWENNILVLYGNTADINDADVQFNMILEGKIESKDIILAIHNKTYKESI